MEQWSRWPLLLLPRLQVRTPCFTVQPLWKTQGSVSDQRLCFRRRRLGQSYRRPLLLSVSASVSVSGAVLKFDAPNPAGRVNLLERVCQLNRSMQHHTISIHFLKVVFIESPDPDSQSAKRLCHHFEAVHGVCFGFGDDAAYSGPRFTIAVRN